MTLISFIPTFPNAAFLLPVEIVYSAVYPTADIINVGGTYDNNDIEMSVYHRVPLLFLDSPNTTSAVNYKVYVKNSGGSNVTISNSNGDSTINLFEVSA